MKKNRLEDEEEKAASSERIGEQSYGEKVIPKRDASDEWMYDGGLYGRSLDSLTDWTQRPLVFMVVSMRTLRRHYYDRQIAEIVEAEAIHQSV